MSYLWIRLGPFFLPEPQQLTCIHASWGHNVNLRDAQLQVAGFTSLIWIKVGFSRFLLAGKNLILLVFYYYMRGALEDMSRPTETLSPRRARRRWGYGLPFKKQRTPQCIQQRRLFRFFQITPACPKRSHTLSLILKFPPCVISLMILAACLQAATEAESKRSISSADILKVWRNCKSRAFPPTLVFIWTVIQWFGQMCQNVQEMLNWRKQSYG